MLSGYRSSPSESSDSHCTETASRRRNTPNEPQRNVTDTVLDASEMNPVDTQDGTPPAGDSSTSVTSQSVTESTNLISSSKDAITTSAYQDGSERMQIGVVSGTCSSSSLVSSCNNSAATLGSQVRSEEMESDVTAPAAPSSVLMSASDDSVSTIATKHTSESIQAGVISASSSTVMSSSNDSLATGPNKDISGDAQADVPSGVSSTLMTSSDHPVSTIANREGTQASVASAGSSTLVTSRTCSNPTAVVTSRAEGIRDEISSTLESTNFQEQHEEAFTDEKMFSSSDEDGDGMDWEPAVSEHSEIESLTEPDLDTEKSFENTRNDVIGTDNSFMADTGPEDKRPSSEPPEISSISLPQRINAEIVSIALTAVSGSDSFEDDMPLSLLAEVSSSVKKAKVSVTRSQGSKKKTGKGMKKDSETPVDDDSVVEDFNSGSEEIVLVLQPDPPATILRGVSNNGDVSGDATALGSTGFPGMDDVLQVIIEEEENTLDTCSSQLETGLQTADVSEEDERVEINSPGDSGDKRKSESIISKEQGISLPRKEFDSSERDESGGNLLLACESHEKTATNNNDVALPDEQDAMETDSFCEVSNDFGNITSDEESISVLEQQTPTCSSLNARGAHDEGINKQGCFSGSAQDKRQVQKSRDQGANGSQVTGEWCSQSARRTAPDLTEINNAVDLCSSVEIPNDRSVPRTLPQSNRKSPRQKNKKNASAKGSAPATSSSSASTRPAGHSTGTSAGKNAHRASQSNGNTLELNYVDTETEGNSQTIQKPKEEPREDVSKAKFRSRGNMFACDLQTLELLWNFKGR